jgi:hypothetical protein
MDIHKPKPWRGWREFLKEYAIIVVGVLTALAAEQAVVWLHDRQAASEARATIDAEVVTDITRVRQRGFTASCVTARLDALDQILDTAKPDGRIQTPSWIGRPPRYGVESTRWDAASQSGRVSLLSSDWQANFGFLYTMLRYYYGMNNDEQAVWSRLDAIAGVDRLTPEMKLSLKADIAQARFYDGSMGQVEAIIMDRAARQGLRPTNRHDAGHDICWPIDTPRQDALARVRASLASPPRR